MNLAGQTLEGRRVVSGVFRMFDTYGLPLDMLLAHLEVAGLVVDWKAFAEDALSVGWKPKTILSRCGEAVLDVYGREHFDSWGEKMKTLLGEKTQ